MKSAFCNFPKSVLSSPPTFNNTLYIANKNLYLANMIGGAYLQILSNINSNIFQLNFGIFIKVFMKPNCILTYPCDPCGICSFVSIFLNLIKNMWTKFLNWKVFDHLFEEGGSGIGAQWSSSSVGSNVCITCLLQLRESHRTIRNSWIVYQCIIYTSRWYKFPKKLNNYIISAPLLREAC